MDEQLNKPAPPTPGSAEPVVIRQPQLDSSVPGPTSLRTVVVRREHTSPKDRNSFGIVGVALVLLATALGATTLVNIAGRSPADAIAVTPPDKGQTPFVLADSDLGSDSMVSPPRTPEHSDPSLANISASETSRAETTGSVIPTTAPPTTVAPPTTPAAVITNPPPTTVPPTTLVPTTIPPTTVAQTVTTVPSTSPAPTELPVPSTVQTTTTTEDIATEDSTEDTKPGKGNSEDAPGKGNKPEKDEKS